MSEKIDCIKFFLGYNYNALISRVAFIRMWYLWRKKNPQNTTIPLNNFPIDKVYVGKGTYGKLRVMTYSNTSEYLEIGNYVSIAGDCSFVLGGGHHMERFTNFPFEKIYRDVVEATTKGPIVIEDDVWIGWGCTILSGVTIGKGAVIAAGSVVAKDVPPYAVYAGNRIIKYRFSTNTVEKLIGVDFSKISSLTWTGNHEILKHVTDENVDMIVSSIVEHYN